MGKGQSPTAEELQFIYDLLHQGYSDADILREYDRLERDGRLGSLPFRYDPRFIRQRRKEYEAARATLGKSESQQTNPLIAKMQEDHYSELRAVVQEWKDNIYTSQIDEIELDEIDDKLIMPFSKHDYQFDPLFDCLREHLPFQTLWENQHLWIREIPDYFECCKRLQKGILEDKRVSELMLRYPKWEQIIKPILECIATQSRGEEAELINIPDPETGEIKPFQQVTMEPVEGSLKRISHTQRQETVKVVGLRYVDPDICRYYMDSEVANEVIQRFTELKGLEEEIKASLSAILIQRSYISTKCKLCPQQSNPL